MKFLKIQTNHEPKFYFGDDYFHEKGKWARTFVIFLIQLLLAVALVTAFLWIIRHLTSFGWLLDTDNLAIEDFIAAFIFSFGTVKFGNLSREKYLNQLAQKFQSYSKDTLYALASIIVSMGLFAISVAVIILVHYLRS